MKVGEGVCFLSMVAGELSAVAASESFSESICWLSRAIESCCCKMVFCCFKAASCCFNEPSCCVKLASCCFKMPSCGCLCACSFFGCAVVGATAEDLARDFLRLPLPERTGCAVDLTMAVESGVRSCAVLSAANSGLTAISLSFGLLIAVLSVVSIPKIGSMLPMLSWADSMASASDMMVSPSDAIGTISTNVSRTWQISSRLIESEESASCGMASKTAFTSVSFISGQMLSCGIHSVSQRDTHNESPMFCAATERLVSHKKITIVSFLIYCPCDPFGARTQDPNIKSVVLYRLS